MLDADKQALRNNTAAIKCKIIVQASGPLPEVTLTEETSIKDWIYTDERYVPEKGFIGQFVARTLEGNLDNITSDFNIIGREIKLLFGVYRMNDSTTTYYDYGNFIVTEPEDNKVNDNTKFESMDYTKKFNIPFDGDYTDSEFMDSYNARTNPKSSAYSPVTASWLAQYTCKQAGVTLATTTFTNSNFSIDINPFRAGETCRDVMKAIAQLAFSWVRIGLNNQCYIDFNKDDVTRYENLLPNSKSFAETTGFVQNAPLLTNTYNDCGIRRLDMSSMQSGSREFAQWSNIRTNFNINFAAGDIFTFSFWAKGTTTTNSVMCYFYGQSGYAGVKILASSNGTTTSNYSDGQWSFGNLVTSTWKRFYVVWQIDPNASSSTIAIDKHLLIRQNYGNDVSICGCMLEKRRTTGQPYLPYGVSQYDVVDPDRYFNLKVVEALKPVDGVGFGMKGIDGETSFKFATGVTQDTAQNIIYLYDNPLLYTFELRSQAVNQAGVLLGLTYTQIDTETIGHPWLTGNELIEAIDINDNYYFTYPFNRTIKYGGHIRSTIDSTGVTTVEKTLGYESDVIRSLTDAWIQVNKNTGEISSQSRRIQEIESAQGDYYTIEQVDDLLSSYESGLTNIFSRTGGNNKFRNSALWFAEGNDFEYWEGTAKVQTDMRAGSQTAIIVQNSSFKQTISDIPNGKYYISFAYERLKTNATLTISIDGNTTTVSDTNTFGLAITVTTNTIDFIVSSNLTDGYKIYDLMCNVGEEKAVWSQYANETRTDTVNISKGITITSTASKAVFKANADGIRIENKSENRVTNFLDDGMETYNAKITGQAEVSGASFTRVGNQTWINGL